MKAAFFDVDGTLTHNRVWSGLFDYFKEKRVHLGTHYVFLIVHYSLYFLHKIGVVSQVHFRSVWAENLSWHFKGFDQDQAQAMWAWVVENRMRQDLRDDMVEVLRQHRRQGDLVFLVSGGPEGLLERFAKEVGADYVIGTRHEMSNGVYTGKNAGPACQGENKAIFIRDKLADLSLDLNLQACTAYADSVSDVEFLSLVGKPVAVYPDDALKQLAVDKGWKIIGD
jgi:HAD superfamily hydrolase (TIGR01490 family)